MAEPTTYAHHLEPLIEGLLHWWIHDERIRTRSESYAVRDAEGWVIIDPLPLSASLEEQLRPSRAVCLTSGQHQRSGWRLQREAGVPVYAPEGARELDGVPEFWYRDGSGLPGGLVALEAPGVGPVHFALLGQVGGARVAFTGDLLVRDGEGHLGLIPDAYATDPDVVKRSVRKILDWGPDVLCIGHGEPVVGGGADAIRAVLERVPDGTL